MARMNAPIIALVCMLTGLSIATMRTAQALGYHPLLGPSIFSWWGVRYYPPWQYLSWYLVWGETPTPWGAIIQGQLWWLSAGVVAGWIGAAWAKWYRGSTIRPSATHGSARWATKREITARGLFEAGNSVILGIAYGRYLRHNGEGHTLVIAPIGAGKTAGLMIPTLLSLTGSVLVFDPKGELWDATAGWRNQLGPCYRLNPCAQESAQYNILEDIRQGPCEIQDIQGLVEVLTNPSGNQTLQGGEAAFWQHSEQAFLTALVLHILYAEPDKTLRGVIRFLSDPQRTLDDTLDIMRTTRHLPTGPHPLVAESARDMLNASGNTRAGINQGVVSHLALYRDPLLEQLMSASSFRLSDLQYAERPISLYFTVPPGDIPRVAPWLRLMLQQATRGLTQEARPGPRRAVDMVLDEFPALGPMPFLTERMAYLRSYNVRATLAIQSLQQLEATYGRDNSVLDLCGIRVLMATYDDRTAQRMSRLTGEATIQYTQTSHGQREGTWWQQHTQTTEVETARQLRTTGEVLRLAPGTCLVLVKEMEPLRGTTVRYFADKTWRARVLPPPAFQPENTIPRAHPWQRHGGKMRMPDQSPNLHQGDDTSPRRER